MSDRINVAKPWIGSEEIAAVTEVIRSGWVAQGPRVAEFERQFATAAGATDAVAVSSCTAALHLALHVIGLNPGDDVVVPSFSFIATANAPTYVGARPVFADVDRATGNVTAETLVAALTPRTRAIIAVDQGGVPVDLDSLRAICEPRGILIVEDAACGAGSTYRGLPVGAGADITAWSFHPRKVLTTGEGGMLTTRRSEWAARARRLREHSMSVSAVERHGVTVAAPEVFDEVGFNFRMTDLQAAMGIVQLSKLPLSVARRRELADHYRSRLAHVSGLRLVADPEHGTTNYQTLWLEVSPPYPLSREQLLQHLADGGISARRGIMAAHRQPAYHDRDTGSADLSVTEKLTASTLVLPLYHELSMADVDRVSDAIEAAGDLA